MLFDLVCPPLRGGFKVMGCSNLMDVIMIDEYHFMKAIDSIENLKSQFVTSSLEHILCRY